MLRWFRFAIPLTLCAAVACAPTGGPGRPSWSAGSWPRDSDAQNTAAPASQPALTSPASFPATDEAPVQLTPVAATTPATCPCPAPAARAGRASGPTLYRFGGTVLRTMERDVVSVPLKTPLIRYETSGGPAYCTGYEAPGTMTRSGREVCFYDRDGDNLFETFAIAGPQAIQYYDAGPFPILAYE